MEGSVFLQMKESGLLAHVRRTVLVNIAKTARQVNLKFMKINYYQYCFFMINTIISKIQLNISVQLKFDSGFPILWYSWNGGQSSMQYKGPKDIDSLMFFINDKEGNTKERKVIDSKT